VREALTRALQEAFDISGELHIQTRHRIELVNFWNLRSGSRILEVGSGPGDTTTVLAAAVGTDGHITAVEKGPEEKIWELSGLPTAISQADLPLSPAVEKFLTRYVYGSSPSLGTPMPVLLASSLGRRVTFHVSMDLLDPKIDFAKDTFDMVVFSHCSWYLDHPKTLAALFQRARGWAKRLAYAEWNLVPDRFSQVPHVLAALLQTHIISLCPSAHRRNIVSLIPPALAREMAEKAGWRIAQHIEIDCSRLQDAVWEGRVAHELANEFTPHLDEYSKSVVQAEQYLLSATEQFIGGASSRDPKVRERLMSERKIQSLSTQAFIAV